MDYNIKNIGILYVAIGKYKIFFEKFYEGCEKYLFPGTHKTYYIFTDSKSALLKQGKENVVILNVNNFGWPGNTLFRYHMFLDHWDSIKNNDFLLFLNANTCVIKTVHIEELIPTNGKRIVVACHPYYYGIHNLFELPFETRPESSSYVSDFERRYNYVGGGFIGAYTEDFLNVSKHIVNNIDIDLKNNITALWHDESHFNKYINEHESKVLFKDPVYFYPSEIDFLEEELLSKKMFSDSKKIIIISKQLFGGNEFMRDYKDKDSFMLCFNEDLVQEVIPYVDKYQITHRIRVYNDDVFDPITMSNGRIVHKDKDKTSVIWNNSGLQTLMRKGNNV